MTILWIYNMPLIPEAGGTERITSLVAKGLTERGHKCMGILVFNEKDGGMTYESSPVADLYTFLKENKVDVVINQIAYAKWLLEDFLKKGGGKWHQEGGKIISCLHFDPCNPSILQLLKSSENWSLRDYITFAKSTILKPYYTRKQQQSEGQIYNFIYDHSDAFVALSPTHFNYMNKVMGRVEYNKLHAIGNPLTFEAEVDESLIKEKKNTILVCARMSEYHKRITLILKSWHKLQKWNAIDGWTLKILGTGPDLERYKRITEEYKLKNIEFLGQKNPESFYKEAKILLLTSSAEGWGLTLTEALQYGVVPVVMNSSSVYKEIITNNSDGLLTPNNDITAFSKAIMHLIENHHQLESMQRNALISSKKFTLNKAIDKWEHLFSKL